MKEQSRESNFIRHWVRIRIDGFRPEKLISQALEKGAVIRQIDYRDETEIYLSVSVDDYKLLKKLARSKYKLTVIKEGGACPTIHKIRMNKMLAAGLALFVLFYLTQACFVREINVIGCKSITEDSIRATLAEEGLYEGGLKNFDCDAIEKRLFKDYKSIVWAKVAYQGNYVQVEIAESEPGTLETVDQDTPCDIVAEQDCYIEKVYTYKGRSQVQKDDFVRKGGILIAGTVPIEHPTYPLEKDEAAVHYVHAAGKIVARVPYYFSFYVEAGSTEAEMEAAVRQWIKENVPENAEILNKDFHFDKKKNIIKLYGTIETRQQVGKEKEIVIDKRQESGTEENTD